MADETPKTPATTDEPSLEVAAETKEKTVPYDRFHEVNKAKRDLEQQFKSQTERLAALEAAEKQRADQEALSRGEHETLLKERDSQLQSTQSQLELAKAQLAEYTELLNAQIEETLKGIPDNLQKLIDGDTPLEKMKQIRRLQEAGVLSATKPTPPDIGATVPTGQGGQPKPIFEFDRKLVRR